MNDEWLTGWTEGAGDVVAVLADAHHRIHYLDDLHLNDRTMSDARTIFDRRFNSFRVPAPTREMARLGIDEGTPDPQGVRAALRDPFTADARAFAPHARPAIAP